LNQKTTFLEKVEPKIITDGGKDSRFFINNSELNYT
jgi:hypothetical protein